MDPKRKNTTGKPEAIQLKRWKLKVEIPPKTRPGVTSGTRNQGKNYLPGLLFFNGKTKSCFHKAISWGVVYVRGVG